MEGRISQHLVLDTPPDSFNPHPVQADMWHFAAYRHGGERVQTMKVLTASPLHDGASGPLLASLDVPIEYLGPAEVTVPAGTFHAQHFRFLHERWLATPGCLVLGGGLDTGADGLGPHRRPPTNWWNSTQ